MILDDKVKIKLKGNNKLPYYRSIGYGLKKWVCQKLFLEIN